ncbi:MAG: hypothetical protein WCI91_00940 [Candidatus Nomurabacteria bacterium]
MNKKQIIFIGGGNSFEKKGDFYEYLRSYQIDLNSKDEKWNDLLAKELGDGYELIKPVMPSKDEADYNAWKIWFEKHFSFIYDENPILIGYSLGGTFLLKYLSENKFIKNISQLHLIGPFVENDESLSKLMSFEFDISKINTISNLCDEMHLWYSEDDYIVPYRNSELVKRNLPEIESHVFNNRGHFFQSSFPELLEVINNAK